MCDCACTHIKKHVCVYLCVHAHIRACVCLYMCICMLCMCAYIPVVVVVPEVVSTAQTVSRMHFARNLRIRLSKNYVIRKGKKGGKRL